MKRITLILLSMILVPLTMMAQSVTVDPTTGKLIAALSYEGESGFENGASAMWRHEQLPLTFTVSDGADLTESGELSIPAGDMRIFNNYLVVHGGQRPDVYCMLSLPKGYRFKGYKIVLLNNLNGVTVGGRLRRAQNKVMYETNSTYNTTNYLARGCYADATNPNLQNSYTMGTTNSDTREYVLTRMSETTDDMGNQLYFRVTHDQTQFFAVTIKSFTVYFTAEGTFGADAKPASSDVALSMVRSPFKTNKIDIGKLENRTNNNQTYFAYTYTNVKDINGYTYIYQDDAVAGGIPMNVAPKKKINPVTIGSGSNAKQYYAFENGTYYVEAPTVVYSQTGLSYPIGFRIVGAKFTPQWGSQVTGGTESRTLYYITYTSGGTTYYLNDQLHFTTTKFGWNYDSTTKNVYVGSGDDAEYLACEGSGGERTLTLSITKGAWFNLSVFTQSDQTYIGWADGGEWEGNAQSFYLIGTTNADETVKMVRSYQTADHSTAARVSSGSEQVTLASYNPGAFTLNVYDKTGTSIAGTASVTNTGSGAGTAIDLTDKATYGYNNDAIKFQITGLETGHQALVDVSVFMQALNPYIDQMNIVCHDNADQLSLSQNFTAENFRVSGGKFKFYIPSEYSSSDLHFTFSDLWSQYGDNTYYTDNATLHKDGYARYAFVTSPYFESVDQNGDNGLYNNSAYDPNASYTNKVYATKAGNIRFKFNNAEGLSNTNPDPDQEYLEEYPFTAANYVGSANPDAASGEPVGAFVDCTMNAQDSESTTYYLFTADETRYNIAPSYSWQHRYYAFYRMEIDLQTSQYDPQLTWTTVYNKTCYNKNGALAEDAMYGLKLKTVDHDTQVAMTGYLTVKQIDDAITAALNTTGAPKTPDQILYVDGGDLYSVLNSKITSGETTTEMTLEDLKKKLADNALIYLPANTTTTLPNCAYKPTDWKTGDPYLAGSGIVLTDNRPFYAPYDIFVDVDKTILHERKVTVAMNGKVTSASIIMPFGILIDEETGIHTNLDGGSFKLHQIQGSNCLTSAPEGAVVNDYVYFPVLKDVKKSDPNVPYLVEVTKAPEGEGAEQISFVLSQKGGTIKATGTGNANWDYTYAGESGSGKKDNTTYTFTNHGSYSGKLLNKTGNFFYFAKNMFLRSNDYAYEDGIKVAPFRAYYSTTSSTSTRSASPLKEFDVIPAALGDVNTDGNVTSADADGILNIILGKEEPKRLTTIMSDVNNDGAITIADVTALVNMILGKQTQVEE